MGPEPESSGKRNLEVPHLCHISASMGPEPESSGKPFPKLFLPDFKPGFNGAGAGKLRKTRHTKFIPRPGKWCFNGAGAGKLRKTPCHGIYHPPGSGASMGPEPESSGKLTTGATSTAGTVGFNGAGAGKLRKTIEKIPIIGKKLALQWGRSRKAPENASTSLVNSFEMLASMGPEPESSGKRVFRDRCLCRVLRFNGAGAGKLRKT